ncbi:GntR family transcriptional regulator [Streptomyces sp. NPDC054932]
MAGRRKGREGGYEQIAAHFRALISSEELGPGDPLPSMRLVCEQFGATITTVNRAYRLLQEEGLTTSKPGVGTVVRSRGRVRIPFSVYEAAMSPGDKGPWERATAAQGLDGRMAVQPPEQTTAPADIAQALGVEPGAPAILRRRRAMIGDEVIQIQESWYPLDVARAAGLDAPGKIVGGILAAMAAAGLLPNEADHRVTAWVPTAEQAAELALGSRVSVLVVERITRDEHGRVLEVARITGAADRMELVYERLPLAGRGS